MFVKPLREGEKIWPPLEAGQVIPNQKLPQLRVSRNRELACATRQSHALIYTIVHNIA